MEYLICLLCVVDSRVQQSIKAAGVPLSLSDKNDGKRDDLGEGLLWQALDLGLNYMQSFRLRCLWHHDIIQNFTELFAVTCIFCRFIQSAFKYVPSLSYSMLTNQEIYCNAL